MASAAALQPPAPPRCPAFFEQCQAVTRYDASRLLADQPPGSYIIRPVAAQSPDSDYTVAYTYVSEQQGAARLQHVRVRYDPRAQLFYHEDRARRSVPLLIESVLEQAREVRVPNRLLNGRSRVVQHLPPRPQRDAPILPLRATGGAVSGAPTTQATRLATNASSLPSVSAAMLSPPPRPPPRRPPPKAPVASPTASLQPQPPLPTPLPTPPVGTQYERFISPDSDDDGDDDDNAAR